MDMPNIHYKTEKEKTFLLDSAVKLIINDTITIMVAHHILLPGKLNQVCVHRIP